MGPRGRTTVKFVGNEGEGTIRKEPKEGRVVALHISLKAIKKKKNYLLGGDRKRKGLCQLRRGTKERYYEGKEKIRVCLEH